MQAETIVVNSLSGNVAANVVVVSSPGGVQVSGNITATSKISALRYTGNGASLTGIGASGAASTVFTTNLAANVVVQTDAAGKLANSSVTVTELEALSGATSAIQTQLNGKLALVTSNVNVGSVAVSGDIVCAGLTSPGTVAAANYILANATNVSGIVGPLAIANVQVCDNSGIAQTDLALDSASGGYVLLNGSGFSNVSTGMLVLANANSTGFGMTVANSTTYISPSKYLCQVPALANGSYTAWMYSGTGGIATLRNALRFSTAPSWTTAATLANITKNAVFSTTLAATSDSAITYSNTTNLPGGVTLNANTGVLSGNISSNIGNTETFGFTVLAMDFELQKALRTFGLTAVGVVAIPTGTGFAALTDGTNAIIMFNTSGSITFSGSVTATILVVAGGGSGSVSGGGGGAGGLITQSSVVIAAGTYTVTVGAGGASLVGRPANYAGNNGSNSVFSTFTAIGGGGGGATVGSTGLGLAGGSGGGGQGTYSTSTYAGGAGTSGQGFSGGQGQYSAGGGGGASAVGTPGSNSSIQLGADGGAGYLFDDRYYAGGGGGMVDGNGIQAKYSMGGLGGGGGGGSVARNGQDGDANSGGGGGGNNSNGGTGQPTGAGGSGIVILKYPLTAMTPSISWVDILLVAGGGGGGSNIGGGGGAGGLVYRRVPVVTGTAYTVTIGSGGSGGAAGGSNMGTNGSNSVFGSYTALGGGAGAGAFATGSYGGSGGGAGYGNVYYAGAGKASQGRRGGSNPTQGTGGGGGGAGGEGAAGNTSTGGAGSNSTPSAALYTAVFGAGIGVSGYFAGGGGGGYTPGSGGAGGGGAGNGNAGVANTGGGGGGGASGNGGGGGGGSGICFVRYLSSYAAAASTTGSPSVSTVAVAGFRVYKFTGSGSITF